MQPDRARPPDQQFYHMPATEGVHITTSTTQANLNKKTLTLRVPSPADEGLDSHGNGAVQWPWCPSGGFDSQGLPLEWQGPPGAQT